MGGGEEVSLDGMVGWGDLHQARGENAQHSDFFLRSEVQLPDDGYRESKDIEIQNDVQRGLGDRPVERREAPQGRTHRPRNSDTHRARQRRRRDPAPRRAAKPTAEREQAKKQDEDGQLGEQEAQGPRDGFGDDHPRVDGRVEAAGG